ncbi:MAG: DUF6458 family protein [Nocardioidaceae bacterium]
MGPGITLVVLGAIMAFAVRAEASAVDVQTVGLILMLAGAAVIVHAHRTKERQEVVTHVEHGDDDSESSRVVHEQTIRNVGGRP